MKKILFAFIIALVMLSGCLIVVSTDSQLKVSSGESWKFHMVIKAPQDQVLMYNADLSAQFDGLAQEAEQNDIGFRWEMGEVDSEGNIDIIIDVQGTGYEKWNNWIDYPGSLQSDELLGESIIRFELSMFGTALGQGLTNSFTLDGGKILSTNGKMIDTNSVYWIDSNQMEAVMETPKANVNLGIVFAIAGIILLTTLIVLTTRKSTNPPQPAKYQTQPSGQAFYPVPPINPVPNVMDRFQQENKQSEPAQEQSEIQYCGKCGSPWKAGANFCSVCGWSKNQTE